MSERYFHQLKPGTVFKYNGERFLTVPGQRPSAGEELTFVDVPKPRLVIANAVSVPTHKPYRFDGDVEVSILRPFAPQFKKYGRANCADAWFENRVIGNGASTIAIELHGNYTTRQVDAMIDAYDRFLDTHYPDMLTAERRVFVDLDKHFYREV